MGGARRVDPEPGPDDAGAGEMGLHHLGLEVLVEEFADRHGPEADRLGHLPLAEAVKALAEIQPFGEVAWPVAYRVGRCAEQQGLDEATVPYHRPGVAPVDLGVSAGDAGTCPAARAVGRCLRAWAGHAGEGAA